MLKEFTYTDIIAWKSCYDPIKYIPKNWKGTAIDILNMDNIPFEDRLWCVLRPELISEKTMRLFAVWCYRQTLKFVKNPDPRSIKCAEIAEKFAEGLVTKQELIAARDTVSPTWSVAWTTWGDPESASCSKWSAAWSAACLASRSKLLAAWSTWSKWSSGAATRAEAWSARSAADSASDSAAWSARTAACSAAWSTWSAVKVDFKSSEKEKLIEMILTENRKFK